METKEIVNLRKLREEFYEVTEAGCDDCPFRCACKTLDKCSGGCIVSKILDPQDAIELSDSYDLYDLEMRGLLTDDFQL